MKRRFYLCILTVLSAGAFYAGSPNGELPAYLYLYARVTDHVNVDVTEDRLRRILPVIEQLRKTHPETHVSATLLFSGSVSQALADRNAQTHILDYVRGFVERGIVEAGYDGTDEPTYKRRPLIDLARTRIAEDRWLARRTTAEAFLTEARDPRTGAPLPGVSGGLKKMEEVFGPAVCITGVTLGVPDPLTGSMPDLGSDSETIHELRHLGATAIMFGIPDGNSTHAPNYRGWSDGFSKAMSPIPETSPDLYWQDNVLRTSEASVTDTRLFHASDGVEAFKKVSAKLDRGRIRVLHVEIANPRSYLAPSFMQGPLLFAYNHPDGPTLPPEARRPAAEVDAAYQKEETFLKFLADDYFPANPGSRFASSADLKRMAGQSTGYRVSVDGLRTALGDLVKTWNGTTLPKYIRADGRYLSLADMFQVMTEALAEWNRTGKLPQAVQVRLVYGPVETSRDKGPGQGEVTVAAVARVCGGLADRLRDTAWSPNPKNSIPFRVPVDGIDLNAAQFLRLMAEALVNPSPEAKLQVKMTDMFWGPEATYYRTRSLRDEGAIWTYKPALLEVAAVSR